MSGMAMGDRHDYVALEWVKGEIAETLKQARQALEDYVEQPEDPSSLQFCLTYIHQVHGTLQMVEFFGAALLAEEMEMLARALLDQRVTNVNEALAVLMESILQLPQYLEHIQAARRDLPMTVLPLLNDLRAARGEKFLSQSSLFNPHMPAPQVSMQEAELRRLDSPQLDPLLRKVRQMLQVSLIGLLRDQEPKKNLAMLARAFAGMEKLSQGAPSLPMWQVAAGLVDGLANTSLELSTSVRTLLRQLDMQLRELVRTRADGINQAPPEALLKDLLFYVAKAQPNSPRLQALHADYRLADALPVEALDPDRGGVADRSAISSVVTALCEELVRVKDSLDLFVRSDRVNPQELSSLQAPMKQIADTLAVLGFSQQRKVIGEQARIISDIADGINPATDATLMDVAGALLYLEATLIGMVGSQDLNGQNQDLVPPTDVAQVHRLVIREARTGLEQAKDGIIEFIASQWKHEHLEPVPHLLSQVRGGLVMIPMERPARLVDSCRRYIVEQLLEPRAIPDWQALDTLADAMTSVEYYLERLHDDQTGDSAQLLDAAEQSLTQLGYAPAEPLEPTLPDVEQQEPQTASAEIEAEDSPVDEPLFELEEQESDAELERAFGILPQEPVRTAQEPQWTVDSPDIDGEPGETAVELEPEPESAVAEQETERLDDALIDNLPEIQLPEEVETPAQPAGETRLADVLAEPVSPLNPPAQDVLPHLLPPPADEEPFDAELQEIFVEEAGEVLETLNEFFPAWRLDRDNKDALTEVRRAFHTLKGSGRMVRALVVGELAWSIENMLNRVLEGSLEVSAPVVQVIADVIELTPELVSEYAAQAQRQRDDVDFLAATAHALARKEPLPEPTGGRADTPVETVVSLQQDLPVTDPEQPEPDTALQEPGAQLLPVEAPVLIEQPDDSQLDPQLVEIFHSEALAHLAALQAFLDDCALSLPRPVSEDLQRALHTLKGSAHMAGITPVAGLATMLEKLVKEYRAHLLEIGAEEEQLMQQAHGLLLTGVNQLDSTPLQPVPGSDELIEALRVCLEQALSNALLMTADESGTQRDPLQISRFLAEGMDALLDMEERVRQWSEQEPQQDEFRLLIDELGDLRDGAEMAELWPVVELADLLSALYQQVLDGQRTVDQLDLPGLAEVHDGLLGMLDEVAAGLEVTARNDLNAVVQDWLEQDGSVSESALPTVAQPESELETLAPELDSDWLLPGDAEGSALLLSQEPLSEEDALPLLTQEAEPLDTAISEPVEAIPYADFDDEMVEIFLDEAFDLLESANQGLEQWLEEPDNNGVLTALMRDLHTLKGGARMAGISPVGDLSHELESVYEGLLDGRYVRTDDLEPTLHAAHDYLYQQLELLQQQQDLPSPAALLERLQVFRKGVTAPAPVAEPVQTVAQQALSEVVEQPSELDTPEPELQFEPEPESEPELEPVLLPEAKTEPVSAEQAAPVGDPGGADPELVAIFLEEAFEILEATGNDLQAWLENTANLQPVESLQRGLHTLKGGARMAEISPVGDLAHELESLFEDLVQQRLAFNDAMPALLYRCQDQLAEMLEALSEGRPVSAADELVYTLQHWRQHGSAPVADEPAGQFEPEQEADVLALPADLKDMFAGDSALLLQQLAASLDALAGGDAEGRNRARNILLTLKGEAALAGLQEVADRCAQMDALLEQGSAAADLHAELEQLSELLVARGVVLPDAPVEPAAALPVAAPGDVATVAPQSLSPAAAQPPQAANRGRPAQQAPQEQVRVPAELLEGLVNLAGETSIFRGRVEQQVSDFGFALNEMETTLDRIRDQLRRLDTETQAQILSRYQSASPDGGEDFDPLEMDRHSHLQQLSRSLFESASDLLDLKETLAARSRDAETLLLQQARVNTELQEGLMRTRMVPFERMVPRLRRIVRQVAAELGKEVELQVANAEGEMDRSVLERMIAPMEHMLRNAVGHGIELPDVRRAAGKQATGRIRLELSREGADVLLVMSDDGAGVNVDAVRRKAIERGLMSENSDLSRQEIMQFILQSGFSTAEQVTQVSGRGVGMDVVGSEIKQIGGAISIESEPGQGTRFVIRLPFTVSVNRALMVMTGEDLYAIPLNTIEGIVRVSPYELEALYDQAREQGTAAHFEYAGQQYDLRYLGDLLANGQQPKLVGQMLPLPVILIRSSEHAVAVQVDSLSGSREIVVKSLGPQFAGVPSLSGATILGDGRVVVILDLLAAIRQQYARVGLEGPNQLALGRDQDTDSEALKVMVVDDSVTVRKVTSRLLERHGMSVITAKDGVEAINLLQEYRPDLMLLDIEMPRMDGFEVATLVRHDEQLKDLPIIMITSRTGSKHRERAMAIGVNDYLGKPYQEAVLLETIARISAEAGG